MMDKDVLQIFKDITVIELSSVLAGPSVGMFFAELGAKVIKVEQTGVGDATRKWKLPTESKEDDYSAYYHSINYGKEIRFLDINKPDDYQSLCELIKDADILTANFKSTSALKLKVDYNTLTLLNPQLIYCQLNAFGEESNRLGYDVVMQAETGFISMTGLSSNQLCKMPVALIDLIAGHHMKEAILIALLKREKLQKGSYIVTALLDAGISSLANQASNYLNVNSIAQPLGLLHPNIAPYGETFTLSDDNKVILAIGNDVQFMRFWEALRFEGVLEQYQTNNDRLINRTLLYDLISKKMSTFNLEAISELLLANKVPFGHIKTIDQVMETAKKRDLFLHSEVEGNDIRVIKTIPFKIK